MQVFFNSSLPRSGSTLLQNILAQNPDFYCSPTSGVSHLLVGARQAMQNDTYLRGGNWKNTQEDWLNFCEGALLGYYSSYKKEYVVDKSRNWLFYYDWLRTFSDGKVVCMVRNLADIVGSLEKLNRHKRYIGDPSTDQLYTVDQRVGWFMNNAPLYPALMALKNVIDTGNDREVLFIRFEDFCNDPKIELKKIYEYLEVEYYEHDIDNVDQLIPEHDAHYGIFGDHQIHRGIVMAPSTNARSLIGDGNVNLIEDNNLWYYDYFKYPMRQLNGTSIN